MSGKTNFNADISLKGLEIAPSQVWGSIRIVPLLRETVRPDLRLMRRSYGEDLTVVSLEPDPGMKYFSYVPHGLVLSWSDDGSPVAAAGTQLSKVDGKRMDFGPVSVRLMHRMAKRESKNQLRFLPLHLAMEGFLSLFFSGPDIAWTEYSQYALSFGLGLRYETAYMGRFVAGLEDALRVFEIHARQTGVLVFVADALACAFVVPSPEDYRLLHTTLLEDFFGELLYQYGLLHDTTYPMSTSIEESGITDLSGLRSAVMAMRKDWAEFQGFMADGLLSRRLFTSVTYSAGPFTMERFITDLDPYSENHIGERILRSNGDLEYLKTYRLSAAQTRRVFLLSKLASHNWNLDATAAALQCSREHFIERLECVGFGYLLAPHVREAARKKRQGK